MTFFNRCSDTYGIGFYRRAYFRCESGTIFSDELDQCVFHNGHHTCDYDSTQPGPPTPPAGACTERLQDCRLVDICPHVQFGKYL